MHKLIDPVLNVPEFHLQAGMFSALQLLDMQLLNDVVLIVCNENESDNEERIIEEDLNPQRSPVIVKKMII